MKNEDSLGKKKITYVEFETVVSGVMTVVINPVRNSTGLTVTSIINRIVGVVTLVILVGEIRNFLRV